MRYQKTNFSRRRLLEGCAAGAALAAFGKDARVAEPREASIEKKTGFEKELWDKISRTPFIDTHQHLIDEDERLRRPVDDWSRLVSGYLSNDFVAAGMKSYDLGKLFLPDTDLVEKWRIIAPYWQAAKNTGYGRQVRDAIRDLYGIDELNEKSIPRLQQAYDALKRPGFYKRVLNEYAGIESCQVNSLAPKPFHESSQPTLLFQDLSILAMHMGGDLEGVLGPAGKKATDIHSPQDYIEVIDWWFEKYAPFAVAVKSQAAYSRGLDYEIVPREKAASVAEKVIKAEPVASEEKKLLQDYLFWYCVKNATKHDLPVKLHLGYYANNLLMPLGRSAMNPAQASDLCRRSPETRFIFMHISYPFWQDLIAVAKHYTNAYIDMCWAWSIDPVSAKQFLKTYLVTVPANKLLTFGGDTDVVECTVGYAKAARHGIWQALSELVQEGWMEKQDALELVDPIMHGNARKIFNLKEKTEKLNKAPWLSASNK